jgi:glycosyltransferase involved in cell wall biosynthesis
VGTGSTRIPPENYGGIERYIFETSRGLAHSGDAVTVFDIKECDTGLESETMDGIRFMRLPVKKAAVGTGFFLIEYIRSKLPLVRFALGARRHIKKTYYDIIHIHVTIVGLVMAIFNRSQRKRMVYTVHSPVWAMENPGVLDRLSIWMDCVLMHRVRHIIVQSEYARDKIRVVAGIPLVKISVVPCGVDTAVYHPAEARTQLMQKYELSGRKVIFFAGRIVPCKGIEYLVKAADIAVNDMGYKDALFLLAGPLAQHGLDSLEHQQYIDEIKGIIKDSRLQEHVKLTGEVSGEDLTGLFQSCDIFVLPSLAESSPAVTLQAISCAKPIIATAVGGVPDQIKNGWNGFIVKPADEAALAGKLEYLLAHPEERLRMGQNGRQLAGDKFDWERVSRSISNVYKSSKN